ncbi:MAG: hypothetical protein Q4A82_01180 [Corynebacterium sp.]|nr:hypothetical protein [Corynebacterium sp.]
MNKNQRIRVALWTIIFGSAGIMHFTAREGFDSIVPPALPGAAKYWTWGSGILELALAAAIANPKTRAKAATQAALFLLGVWPGNIQMALDWQRAEDKSVPMKIGAWARVIGQIPMMRSVKKLKHAAG